MSPFWADDLFDEETGRKSPNVKCDGFTVGGRYDGVIWSQERHYNLSPDAFQRRYGCLTSVLPRAVGAGVLCAEIPPPRPEPGHTTTPGRPGVVQ